MIKHPEIVVRLTGKDGNVFGIIGAVSKALKNAGHKEEAIQFTDNAFGAGSYDAVLRMCMETVTIE